MTTYRVHYDYSGRSSYDIDAPNEIAAEEFFREHIRKNELRDVWHVLITRTEEKSPYA